MVSFVFSANQAGGNLGHKHITVKFDDPLQSVYSLVEQTKKSRKIASLQITTLFFLNLPKRSAMIHFIFQPEFPVCPCKWLSVLERCLLKES